MFVKESGETEREKERELSILFTALSIPDGPSRVRNRDKADRNIHWRVHVSPAAPHREDFSTDLTSTILTHGNKKVTSLWFPSRE